MTHHDPTFWLLARASGLTAYVLLTLSVLAGLVLKSRPFARLRAPQRVTEVHKTLALTGLGRSCCTRLARARHDGQGEHRRRSSFPGSSPTGRSPLPPV